jgi:hypothetical protein
MIWPLTHRHMLLLWACTMVIGLSGCGHINSKKKAVNEEHKNLPQWLQKIDQGELSDWKGWSNAWRIDDLLKTWQPKGEAQQQQLGTQTLSRYEFALTQQTQPLQVLADSQGQVVRVLLEDAVLKQSANEIQLLWGTPTAKDELPSDHKFAPAQRWAYPQRGITLYVLDAQKHGPLSLSAIALYVPTTLEIYLRDLEGDERVRMWED